MPPDWRAFPDVVRWTAFEIRMEGHSCESERHAGQRVPASFLNLLTGVTSHAVLFPPWYSCEDCRDEMRADNALDPRPTRQRAE